MPRSNLFLLCAALAATSSALPALAGDLPPPGLYQIDFDGAASFNGGIAGFRQQTDGATGDVRASSHAGGVRSPERQFKGDGPVTYCMKAQQAGQWQVPGALQCKTVSTTRAEHTLTVVSSCPTSKNTLTIRQLDATHWEFLSEVDQGSATVVPTMAPMAAVLKHQAQHGATAQERADAERQLAALPGMQKEMDQQRVSTQAMFEQQLREAKTAEEKEGLRRAIAQLQGTPALKGQSRALWTRLSNACK